MRDPRKEARAFNKNVPASARYFYGENTQSSIQWQRITNAGSDRVEQGNTFWTPIRISVAPVGT